jgi:hypothetical protein
MSVFCPKSTPNKLALNLEQDHNQSMKTVGRFSRVCGWSVRYACVVLALAFCASAFAADPSKNVVVPARQQVTTKTVKKICLVVTGSSAIPQPCERLAAIPTTANPMTIIGHAPETRR